MNTEEIIRMAREVGMHGMLTDVVTTLDEIERFAALVAQAEREACAKTVERARLHMDGSLGLTHETDFLATRITDFLAAQIRATEKR